MATFVLVHGSRHGGWCWQRVARLLRERGHEVYCPTLSGTGDRAHVPFQGAVNLDTHIQDITALLFYEDLRDVVLVGHSYSGMVITGVAGVQSNRLAHLVYLDALLPRPGESHLDLAGPAMAAELRRAVAGPGRGLSLPASSATPERFGVTNPEDSAWVAARLTDQPAGTYEQALATADMVAELPSTFVRCLRSEMIAPAIIARAQAASSVRFVELDACHDAMITDPEAVARLLVEVAKSAGLATPAAASNEAG